ncbi:hypothetical protein [Bacteroides sp.]|uniref:hypothetical protein n=1 Tax=Bacteroides sp. TaxID=29523 RepID=UPI002618C40D|nr:hypothetical protein [Bacteroides sp.]MDD3039055.1 hypothetical protein [Bacteroides sp.]
MKPLTADDLPTELKEGIKAFKNDITWTIFLYILHHKKTTLQELSQAFPKQYLNYPLYNLTQGGHIIKKTNNLNDPTTYYYVPTITGQKLFDALMNVYLPKLYLYSHSDYYV